VSIAVSACPAQDVNLVALSRNANRVLRERGADQNRVMLFSTG
jgi:hypothetical protein